MNPADLFLPAAVRGQDTLHGVTRKIKWLGRWNFQTYSSGSAPSSVDWLCNWVGYISHPISILIWPMRRVPWAPLVYQLVFAAWQTSPSALRLKTANIYLAPSSVVWLWGLDTSGWFCQSPLGSADLRCTCPCVCGQRVGQLGPASVWWPCLDHGVTGAHSFSARLIHAGWSEALQLWELPVPGLWRPGLRTGKVKPQPSPDWRVGK